MANSSTTNGKSGQDTEQLAEQIEQLKADLAGITETLHKMGVSRKDAAMDSARDAAGRFRAQGEHQFHVAQSEAEALGRQAAEMARDRPGMAMGLAVGAGFLVGYLTARR